MNPKQLTVLIVAVVLFLVSELFPPWLYEDSWNSAEKSAGYHFIFGPAPEIKPYSEMKRIFSIPDEDPQHGFNTRKDFARLFGQRLSLLFITLGLFLMLDARKSHLKTILGGISLFVGLGFVGLYVVHVSRYWS